MDGLNDRVGLGTVGIAAQGPGARAIDTKLRPKSPAWTAPMCDISRVR
nr:DUF4113 domain-containing protein [Sphingomonas sp. PAMC26645]